MIRDVHPRSGSWFLLIPDPGVKMHRIPNPGSETMENWMFFFHLEPRQVIREFINSPKKPYVYS